MSINFVNFLIVLLLLNSSTYESFKIIRHTPTDVSCHRRPRYLVPPEMLLGSDSSLWKSCEDVLISQGLLNDAVVMGATSTVGDLIAQFSQGMSDDDSKDFTSSRFSSFMDFSRVKKYSVFGVADGVVSHVWVYSLAALFQGQSYLDTVYSIFADSLFYTPLWCVWFLSAMAALEKKCLVSFFSGSFHTEWRSLIKISLGFYVPLNCVVYSMVPVQHRVIAFALGSLLNTALVSYWSDSTRVTNSINQIDVEKSISELIQESDSSSVCQSSPE